MVTGGTTREGPEETGGDREDVAELLPHLVESPLCALLDGSTS